LCFDIDGWVAGKKSGLLKFHFTNPQCFCVGADGEGRPNSWSCINCYAGFVCSSMLNVTVHLSSVLRLFLTLMQLVEFDSVYTQYDLSGIQPVYVFGPSVQGPIHLYGYGHTHTQPFYGSLDFVRDNPGEPVPEETIHPLTYCGHHSWI